MLGKRIKRRVNSRRGTVTIAGERTTQLSEEEFFQMSIEQLMEFADKIGISLQGALTIEQARARLLNDVSFT